MIFDPLGVLGPILLPGKVLLQKLCRLDYDWDAPFSCELLKDCNDWCETLRARSEVVLDRCIFPNGTPQVIEMHHFADASSTGYSACSYVRYIDPDGQWQVRLLMGKCKVVPLKPVLSVPRLELMAAVLSTELASILKYALPLDCKHFFWTELTTLLQLYIMLKLLPLRLNLLLLLLN